MTEPITGGCQCGAVRYRIDAPLAWPHICHCRMCQKAAGNYFMPLANAPKDKTAFTRGAPSWFQSSDPVRRGFCAQCGTPLIFETMSAPHLNIVLGSLDDPAAVRPAAAYGNEARMPWIAEICAMAGPTTEADPDQDGVHIAEIAATNHQHPDHDTDDWPPPH